MGMIYHNLQTVRAQIAAACADCGRNPNEVSLLAVSKTFSAEAVRQAYAAGQRQFGENYIQEGVDKIAELTSLQGLVWHMIGPIQSNKTRAVAEHFDWVHSVDRLKTAQRLSQQRPAHLPPLQVCIQVNIDDGANKSGVAPGEALPLAEQVSALPQLCLRGLMVIPEPTTDLIAACAIFQRARGLFDILKERFASCDTLSMGMSADMAAAVQQGSTMVRVGTAIFGRRS
jgi:PLP dependent protein